MFRSGANLGSVVFRAGLEKWPDLSDGGFQLLVVEIGLFRFVSPKEFSACSAVTSGDARDDCFSDPKKIIMKLHINWGRAPASEMKRVRADSEGGNSHVAHFAANGLEPCDVCKASGGAPHVPIAGTSTVPMFNGKAQVGLPFPDDLIALHDTGMFSRYSLLLPVKAENPKEVWDVLCGVWLGASGPPQVPPDG